MRAFCRRNTQAPDVNNWQTLQPSQNQGVNINLFNNKVFRFKNNFFPANNSLPSVNLGLAENMGITQGAYLNDVVGVLPDVAENKQDRKYFRVDSTNYDQGFVQNVQYPIQGDRQFVPNTQNVSQNAQKTGSFQVWRPPFEGSIQNVQKVDKINDAVKNQILDSQRLFDDRDKDNFKNDSSSSSPRRSRSRKRSKRSLHEYRFK